MANQENFIDINGAQVSRKTELIVTYRAELKNFRANQGRKIK